MADENLVLYLGPNETGLIAAGEPTLAKGFDKAVTKADKVVKSSMGCHVSSPAARCSGSVHELSSVRSTRRRFAI